MDPALTGEAPDRPTDDELAARYDPKSTDEETIPSDEKPAEPEEETGEEPKGEEPKPAEEKDTRGAEPTIHDHLRGLAEHFGISSDQIASALEAAATGKPSATPPAKQEQAAAKAAEEAFKVLLDIKTGDEDEDGYDPKLVGAINDALGKMNEHYSDQMKEMRQQFDAMIDDRRFEAAQKVEKEFDAWINGLPENWKKLFGEGPANALDPNSAEYKARLKVLEKALQFRATQSGEPIAKSFELAKYALHHKEIEAEVAERIKGDLKERTGQAIGAPAGKPKQTKSGDDDAMDFADNWWKDRGMLPTVELTSGV